MLMANLLVGMTAMYVPSCTNNWYPIYPFPLIAHYLVQGRSRARDKLWTEVESRQGARDDRLVWHIHAAPRFSKAVRRTQQPVMRDAVRRSWSLIRSDLEGSATDLRPGNGHTTLQISGRVVSQYL